MRDPDCVAFLQWALPRLALRWPGFRKVRHGVCKRVDARIAALGLAGVAGYRTHLERTPAEWPVLDELCRITISCFYRDRGVFDFLGETVLPELARRAQARGRRELRAWSVGCASGEEPYTLMLVWRLRVAPRVPDAALHVLATDVDEPVLARARAARYAWGSVKELPAEWRARAFEEVGRTYELRAEYRAGVELRAEDVRVALPAGRFDLILCRNLAFTYFDEPLQRATLARLESALLPGGALVIGKSERLPAGAMRLEPWSAPLGVHRLVEEEGAAAGPGGRTSRASPTTAP